MRADNSRHLTAAAHRRAEQTRTRAVRALRRLDQTGAPVTFEAVALAADVSRSWLYGQPDLRDQIQALRARHLPQPPTPRLPQRQAASETSLLRRLHAATERISQLEADNHQLRQALAEALGATRAARVTGHHPATRRGDKPPNSSNPTDCNAQPDTSQHHPQHKTPSQQHIRLNNSR